MFPHSFLRVFQEQRANDSPPFHRIASFKLIRNVQIIFFLDVRKKYLKYIKTLDVIGWKIITKKYFLLLTFFTCFHLAYRGDQPPKILSPFHAIDSFRRNEISLVDFQHERKNVQCPTNFYDRLLSTKGRCSISNMYDAQVMLFLEYGRHVTKLRTHART